MFCTICAAPLTTAGGQCAACGLHRVPSPRFGASGARGRSAIRRLINLVPLVALLAAIGLTFATSRLDQRDAAAFYRDAVAAEADGRIVAAGRLFASAGDYADAAERANAINAWLAPYATAYDDGVVALGDGDFAAAIAVLLPVARDVPDYRQAPELLEQARAGHDRELLRDARNAEAQLDWRAAERIYATLAAEHPDDPAIAAKLQSIRQERAVYVFSLRQHLHVANPVNDEPVLVIGEIKAAWPVWNPDRSRIAFVSPADQRNGYVRALYVVDADGSNLRKLAEDPARWRPVFWSPDGERIAYEVDGASVGDPTVKATIKIVELSTGEITDIIGDAFPNGSSPAWSPAGDRIAFVVRGIELLDAEPGVPAEILRVDVSTVYVLTLATGAISPLAQGELREPWRISWSPVGEELLVFARKDGSSFRQGAIYRLNATTGAVVPIARSTDNISAAVWSPDGARFAYTIDGSTLRIVGMDGATVELASPIALQGWLTWSPSSDRLLAMGQSGQTYSMLVELSTADAEARAIELVFDSEGGDAGPPQWSSANPAAPPSLPSFSGTALDG